MDNRKKARRKFAICVRVKIWDKYRSVWPLIKEKRRFVSIARTKIYQKELQKLTRELEKALLIKSEESIEQCMIALYLEKLPKIQDSRKRKDKTMLTPEEAVRLQWEIWSRLEVLNASVLTFGNMTKKEKKHHIDVMEKFLPLVTEAAMYQERAWCAAVIRNKIKDYRFLSTKQGKDYEISEKVMINILNQAAQEIEKGKNKDV